MFCPFSLELDSELKVREPLLCEGDLKGIDNPLRPEPRVDLCADEELVELEKRLDELHDVCPIPRPLLPLVDEQGRKGWSRKPTGTSNGPVARGFSGSFEERDANRDVRSNAECVW